MICVRCKVDKSEDNFIKYFYKKRGKTYTRRACNECENIRHKNGGYSKKSYNKATENLTYQYLANKLRRRKLPINGQTLELIKQLIILKRNIKIYEKL